MLSSSGCGAVGGARALCEGDWAMALDERGKTREQLALEITTMQQRIDDLELKHIVRNGTERDFKNVERDLRERVKELNCLLSISKLREKPDMSIGETLQGIVDLIPGAWQYPAVTCARVVLTNLERKTANFRETQWKLTRSIVVQGEPVGHLEVCYLSRKPARDIGPFLNEEMSLLEAIAERIEKVFEQDRAEQKAREQQQQMVQLDKMVALGTLVSGVAHEINNPNNFVMLNTPVLREAYTSVVPIIEEYYADNGDFLMGGLPYSDLREKIFSLFDGILEGSRRINSIVRGLKGFARVDPAGYREAVDLNSVVESALVLVRNQITLSTSHFSLELAATLPPVKGNSQRLEQVIMNLVQNACEALPNRRQAVMVRTSSEGDYVVVQVQDEGCGIPADQLPRVMDPFYTSKRSTGGTGLGLSVSVGIVKDHGGTLSLASGIGEGTTATLRLPVLALAEDASEAAS